MKKHKTIAVTCVHGRHETMRYCFERTPVERVVIYSTDKDGLFLEELPYLAKGQYENKPLSFKWNAAIQSLRQLDFENVILLGSDDYVNQSFVDFIEENIGGYDMIGFTDIYFESNKEFYYWKGYENKRIGEPIGAGKTFKREFLERIDFNLFPVAVNVGLDGLAHNVCLKNNANMLVTSLKQNGILVVDVKDGEGMNPLEKIKNLYNLERC